MCLNVVEYNMGRLYNHRPGIRASVIPYSGKLWRVLSRLGKLWAGKNMAVLVQNRQLFPVIILPSQNVS